MLAAQKFVLRVTMVTIVCTSVSVMEKIMYVMPYLDVFANMDMEEKTVNYD